MNDHPRQLADRWRMSAGMLAAGAAMLREPADRTPLELRVGREVVAQVRFGPDGRPVALVVRLT